MVHGGPSHIQSERSVITLSCGCSVSASHFGCLILEGSALTNGGLNLHSPVKRKLESEKDYVFDKRLRYSVRQNESNCRFRDIVVRKEEGFTHILLSSQTSDNNALTPEVRDGAPAGRVWLGRTSHSEGGTGFLFVSSGANDNSQHTCRLDSGTHVLITSYTFSI